MSTTGMIVSIIAVLGALVLATSNARFREAGRRKLIRLALIWVAIICGLVVIVELAGFRVNQ